MQQCPAPHSLSLWFFFFQKKRKKLNIKPQLTQPTHSWAGLQHKIRHAEAFVPVILSTTVLSESTAPVDSVPTVVREATFKEGFHPGGNPKVKETCKSYGPSRVDFHQPDGSTISNIISTDADGGLNMTYSFSWKHDGVEQGSEEEKGLREKHAGGARIAVEKSIEAMRTMVQDGTIEA